MPDRSADINWRTDDNPFESDDASQQHLLRALELVELEVATDGGFDQRALYDATAHLRMAAVQGIIGDAERDLLGGEDDD